MVGFKASLADEKMPQQIRSIEGITEYALENGLKVLLFPDVSRPTVTVNLTVLVGSRHEGYGEAGMAHLLEHMLFKGTPTHPEIPRVLKERGATFNGTTWYDRTNYYEKLPASDDNLEFAIRLEADRMINSHIKGEDLASEMSVVRNEFERGENSPSRILMQRMMSASYEWHNYGKSTIGNRADIERVPVENLKAFYNRFYQPDNAILIIAGKFDSETALKLTQKYFGSIPRPDRELNRTYTEEPAQDGERLVTLRRVGDVPMAGLTYHIPAGAHPDFAAVDVLTTLMSSEPSGRLYEGLVKKRQAASVFGFTFALHDPGIVLYGAEAAQGIDATSLLQGMIDVVEAAAAKGFTETEVERARQELLKQRELSIADSSGIAIELTNWAAQGDWRLFFLYRDRLEAVTVDDVTRVAQTYLIRNNRTAGLFEPTTAPERADVPATPSLDEMIGDYKGREQIAQGEEFDAGPMAIESRIARSNLKSGITVALLPKKTRGETVNLRLALRYGNLDALKGKATAADYMPAMMLRGTERMSRQEISDALDKYRAQLSISGDAGTVTVSLQTLRGNLIPVLEIIHQALRSPVFPEDELELLKEAQLASAEQRLTDPTAIASNLVQRKISVYEPDDPRYIASLQEEIERIKSVTVDQIKDLYNSLLGAQNGELSIVGDFEPSDVLPVIEKIVADWKSSADYERIAKIPVNNDKGGMETVNTPDKANATYFAAMTLPLRDDHPDVPALTLGNYILGGGALSSRLGNRVRQNEGLSYTVQSAFQSSSVDQRSVFYVFAISNPENAQKLHEVIQEEIAKLLKDGITEQELNEQRVGLLQSQELQRTRDASLATLLGTHLQTGRTMQFTADFEDRLRALTVDDVNAALRKHIQPERLFITMAGDFQGLRP
ncbi:MAG: insulinase family protein [Planctomycetaceae bacterium]|nr:insulinase family protein [Planctomycetaceae bacterium]